MLNGLYVPGNSILHRARPGVKLVGLALFTTLLFGVPGPVPVAVGAAVLVVAALAAGLSPRWLARQVWGLRWIIVALGIVQTFVGGPERAFVVVGGLTVAIVAAALVTATTRTTDMMDAVVRGLRPFRRFGVDPDRVGLLFSLAMRSIFVVGDIVREVGEARTARGLDRSLRALLVPVVIRTVRHGERVGEALVARGLDD